LDEPSYNQKPGGAQTVFRNVAAGILPASEGGFQPPGIDSALKAESRS
jgi:hypothetical protein